MTTLRNKAQQIFETKTGTLTQQEALLIFFNKEKE